MDMQKKMKVLLNLKNIEETDEIILKVIENEKHDIIIIKDFRFFFYIKNIDQKKLSSIIKYIQIDEIDGRSFTEYYEEDKTEKFLKIIVKEYKALNMILKVIKRESITSYESDVDILNKFLVCTGLRKGSRFKMDGDSYKNINVDGTENIANKKEIIVDPKK